MKKLLSLTLVLVLLSSLSISAFAAKHQKVSVVAEKTSIFENSSTKSTVLVTVKKDYTFTPVDSTKSFWKIEFKKKNSDKVYTGYILKSDTTEIAEKEKSNTTTVKQSSGSSTKSLSTVYWTSGGKSYHLIKGCRSLARSSNIKSGTLEEAKKAGNHDPCNNCVR